MAGLAVPQVEGRAAGQVEQLGVLLAALDLGVGPRQGRLEVVADVFVELLVLLVGDFALGSGPEGAGLVDRLVLIGQRLLVLLLVPFLFLHQDGLDDVVGVLADDGTQLPAVGQVLGLRAQMQGDLGAARRLVHHLQSEFAAAVGLPAHPLARLLAGAPGQHGDAVGDDEGGVETDAELTDQVGVLLLVAGELGEELAGPRLGDGTQVGDHLVAAHADPVVGDGQGLGRLVVGDADRQFAVVFEQRAVVQRLEAQLVAGVRGVGDQLAQKDFAVAVERMDHQLQQLLDLGLEAQGLARAAVGGGRCRHWVSPARINPNRSWGGLADFKGPGPSAIKGSLSPPLRSRAARPGSGIAPGRRSERASAPAPGATAS